MYTHQIIDTTIRILNRLKQENPAFQEDALWKLGDWLAWAVDGQLTLDEDEVMADLWAMHQRIEQAMREDNEAREGLAG